MPKITQKQARANEQAVWAVYPKATYFGVDAKKNFPNPEMCVCQVYESDAFDAKVSPELDAGTYTDPRSGASIFEGYAEEWRKARTHGETTGINVEHQFRLHVYADPDKPGRTRRGGPALGDHRLHDLANRPSLCQQWIAGMRLADSTKVKVIDRVSEVLSAAVDDGLISRNPLHANPSGARNRTGTRRSR